MDTSNILIAITSVWFFLIYDKELLKEYNAIWDKLVIY